MFDQLAGALGSLKLGKEEERREKKEKKERRKRRDEKVLRDNDVTEEQARDGMVEMFRKSVQELEYKNTAQLAETQKLSSSKMQGLTKWGRMGNLNVSQGSGRPEGHMRDADTHIRRVMALARSRMSEGRTTSRMSEGRTTSRMSEGRTTSRMPEDMTRSGRVGKVTRQRGEVEVLRFLSLKLVREVLLLYIFFTFNLAEEHDLTLFLDFVLFTFSYAGRWQALPLPLARLSVLHQQGGHGCWQVGAASLCRLVFTCNKQTCAQGSYPSDGIAQHAS